MTIVEWCGLAVRSRGGRGKAVVEAEAGVAPVARQTGVRAAGRPWVGGHWVADAPLKGRDSSALSARRVGGRAAAALTQ